MKCKKVYNKQIDATKLINSKYFIPDANIKWNTYNLSWFDIETTLNYLNEQVNINKTDNNILRVKSVDLNLNNIQSDTVKTWIEGARIIYNITVKYFRKNKLCSLASVRKQIYNLIPSIVKNYNIPKHIVDNSISDVIKAHKTSIALIKGGYIKTYQIKYKKITKNKQTIVIEKQDFSKVKNSFYIKSLNEINSSTPINNIKYDTRLSYDKLKNKFTLYVPSNKETKIVNNRKNKCGIDPGNKTFLTCYNPENKCLKIFNRDKKNKLTKLVKRKIILTKLFNEFKLKKYKSALLKNNKKIINIVKELHYKSALYLCLNFDEIYLGKLSTKAITSNEKSNLCDFEKLYTYAISHFKFSTILKNKCEEYNVKFKLVDEAFTTRTCGKCAVLNNNVGANRIFNCTKCNIRIDRDLNGARNILIKHI
jgi:transposase